MIGRGTTNDPLLTVIQVCKRFKLGRNFVYYQITKGRIRAKRPGGPGRMVLVPLSAVTAFLARRPLYVTPDGKRFYESPGRSYSGTCAATKTLSLKLTPHERAAAERVAQACDLSLSDLCRMALGDAIAEYDEGARTTLRRVGRRARRKRAA